MKYYGLYGARTRDLLRDKQARTPTSPTTQDNDSQLLNTITNNKTIIHFNTISKLFLCYL